MVDNDNNKKNMFLQDPKAGAGIVAQSVANTSKIFQHQKAANTVQIRDSFTMLTASCEQQRNN